MIGGIAMVVVAAGGVTGYRTMTKPKFAEVAHEFLEFVKGAELVIHNAAFDVAFLNREFDLVDLKRVTEYCPSIVDTLRMAKDLHPGKRNNLDALCERYQVDNSGRKQHGALLDAQLLAEVYLAMTRGQDSLVMEVETTAAATVAAEAAHGKLDLAVIRASKDELAAHARLLEEIDKESKGATLWRKLEKA